MRTNLQAVGIEAIRDDSDRDSSGRKIVLKRIPQPDRPKEEDPEKSKGGDTSQQGEKNDVSDGMMSENQEYQELTSDHISDNKNRNENDVRNDVRPNYAKTLETDNTDIISETSLEDDTELEHGEFCDCAECCPNVDPWERQ